MRWNRSTSHWLSLLGYLSVSLAFFCALFLALVLSHWSLLRLPYYWDEAGYYIPAAWDFFRTGSLIPLTTLTNAHPPLPSLWLALWWKLFGYAPLVTRLATLFAAAVALFAVYRLSLQLLHSRRAAAAVLLLTALYPVWFAQSALAHADIFAAACTLPGLCFALSATQRRPAIAALCFSLAALAKETSIVIPMTLALAAALEFFFFRTTTDSLTPLAKSGEKVSCNTSPGFLRRRRTALSVQANLTLTGQLSRISEICWMASCALPLAAWYLWHKHKTGFLFGNPVFLRYNAQANLVPIRFLAALGHRLLHLTAHMNLFVPVVLALSVLLLPRLKNSLGLVDPLLEVAALRRMALLFASNAIFFSILGGALLTRYLLPIFPLVLILIVAVLRSRTRKWPLLVAVSAIAFVAGLFVDPPYGFAPEDNLSWARFIRLHQAGIAALQQRYPDATVLSAWPLTDALTRPELGYLQEPFTVVSIDDFSAPSIALAEQHSGSYTTALVFSTKLDPHSALFTLGGRSRVLDEQYFGQHDDLSPAAIARTLDGEVVWQQQDHGLWIALIRFHNPVQA